MRVRQRLDTLERKTGGTTPTIAYLTVSKADQAGETKEPMIRLALISDGRSISQETGESDEDFSARVDTLARRGMGFEVKGVDRR